MNEPLVNTHSTKGRTAGTPKRSTREYKGRRQRGSVSDSHLNRPRISEKIKGKSLFELGGHRFELTPYSGGANDEYVRIDEVNEVIFINEQHPMFKKASREGADALKTYIGCNVLRCLVDYKVISIDNLGLGESQSVYNLALKTLGEIQ